MLADYYTVLAAPDGGLKPEFSFDEVHVTPKGYAAMRPVFEAALKQAQSAQE